jgi:hypothetical protein
MRLTLYTPWVAILGVLCVAAPLAVAAEQTAGQPPRARIVTVEGAATTYQVECLSTSFCPAQAPGDCRPVSIAAPNACRGCATRRPTPSGRVPDEPVYQTHGT